jgi:hypothetical protein
VQKKFFLRVEGNNQVHEYKHMKSENLMPLAAIH